MSPEGTEYAEAAEAVYRWATEMHETLDCPHAARVCVLQLGARARKNSRLSYPREDRRRHEPIPGVGTSVCSGLRN